MKRAMVLFGRALRLRCPACGGGPLYRSWFTMRPDCPGCGLRLEREEGYFLGAMLLNVIVAEGLFIASFVAALVLTWPTPPWDLLTWASLVGVVLFPLALYPFSRTLWLAFDLLFQPVRAEERAQRSASPAPPTVRPPDRVGPPG